MSRVEAEPVEQYVTEVRSLAPRPSPPAREAPVPAVDPSRVPVEEDFVEEAARRVTSRSNLELELQRLAKEIGSAPR